MLTDFAIFYFHEVCAVDLLDASDDEGENRIPVVGFLQDKAMRRGSITLADLAGGAAQLPGLAGSKTVLPVLGVPMDATVMKGMDALLSIVQMPGGVPVGTLAVGKPGAINAALMATSMLGEAHPELREALRKRRQAMTEKVLEDPDPRQPAKGA